MTLHTIVARVMNVVERKRNLNQESQIGKVVHTRKKPHVMYVALKVCSPVN